MHSTLTIQTRPDTATQFYFNKETDADGISKYIRENYAETGKLKKIDQALSDDTLTLTTTIQWESVEDFLEFTNDVRINKEYIDPFHDYLEKAGIKFVTIDKVNKMTSILGPDPYPNLTIPDTWENVEDFANWWISSGMPMLIPEDAEVFLSDDATAVSLFRKGRFQVELYLIHPHPKVPVHGHPDVEVIKVRMTGRKRPYLSAALRQGGQHGAGLRLESEEKGYPLLAIQHWLTREPTTIASMWEGNTVGPLQENLIKRFNPNAYLSDGYADTSTDAPTNT
jgi:hypothetical protein